MRIGLTALLLLLLTHALARADEPTISELHGGRWIDIAQATTQQAPDDRLIAVEQMIQQGRSKDAFKSIVIWLQRHQTSPFRDRGIYLAGEALYEYGDRIRAFFYFDELMDEFPESTLYYTALQKQFDIADAYLGGYKRRFLRVFRLGAEEEAIEMLFRIQARSPGSQLAERALLRTADHYYASSDYDLAADAYAAYIKAYPRSLLIPRIKLRQAYANLAQFKGLRFDATPVVDARSQLQDVVAEYPDISAEEDIPALLSRIDRTFARKLEVTADYYRRVHEYQGAAYTIGVLNHRYPNYYDSVVSTQTISPTTKPTP